MGDCEICNCDSYEIGYCAKCQIKMCNYCSTIGQYCSVYHLYECIHHNKYAINGFMEQICDIGNDKYNNEFYRWIYVIRNEQRLIQSQINTTNAKQTNFFYFELKRFLINDIANIVLSYC